MSNTSDKFFEASPEQYAYHGGWSAFFTEKIDGVVVENPFETDMNPTLHDAWKEGWLTAKKVADSME